MQNIKWNGQQQTQYYKKEIDNDILRQTSNSI
jgi:hypothetical protein